MNDRLKLNKFDCGVRDHVVLQEIPKWVDLRRSPMPVVGTVVGIVDAKQGDAGGRIFESINFLVRTGDGKLASFSGDTTIREVRDEGDGRKIPVIYIRRKKNN